MYQQPNHSYASTDSIRRLSSNNPFRATSGVSDTGDRVVSIDSTGNRISSNSSNGSVNMVRSPNSKNFDNWVAKNKKLVQENDSFEDDNYNNYLLLDEYAGSTDRLHESPADDPLLAPPTKPKTLRTNSDSSVKMSSNNPFASALNGGYVHHRDPPVPPASATATRPYKSGTPPARPPKSSVPPPPPPYEEAAGREAARKEYAREKASSSSGSSSSRPHRSHSDGARPHRSHRSRADKHEKGEKHRSSHHKSSKKSPTRRNSESVKAKNLDTIDKLDVTGFFGGGFHHDGPFDACTPHRNKNTKVAPVMAFPVDGPNSSIKGQQNIKTEDQMNLAFGNYQDQNEIVGRKYSIKQKLTSKSSDDVSTKSKTTDLTNNGQTFNAQVQKSMYDTRENPSVVNFDAHVKSEPVHGIQTAGLGSSTFIDGAPAPKGDDNLNLNSGGLGRKKSLVQRLRKNSGSEFGSRRSSQDHNMRSGSGGAHSNSTDELNTTNSLEVPEGNSLMRRVKSLKVGRRER